MLSYSKTKNEIVGSYNQNQSLFTFNKTKMKRIYLLSLIIALFTIACDSETTQESEEQTQIEQTTSATYETVVIKGDIPSPQKEMRAKIGSETLTVNYGSPSVKDRTIWGDLVPYDSVWRTGANEATTFETSTNVKVQGEELPAGKYGLFTIPTAAGEWTIIFNSVSEQWGAYEYDESKDVLRVKATATALEENSETLEFVMDGNNLVLNWEKIALPIDISL